MNGFRDYNVRGPCSARLRWRMTIEAMLTDRSKPSPLGAYFVHSNRTLFRTAFVAALALVCGVAGAQAILPSDKATPNDVHVPAGAHKPDAKESASMLELRQNRMRGFLENKGQWPKEALFAGRSNGLDLWVLKDGLMLDAYAKSDAAVSGHVVGVKFLGAKPLAAKGFGETGILTDFIGYKHEARSAKTFVTIKSNNIYPGITLKNYFDGSRPRYDFVLAPRADVSKIRMKYGSVLGLKVDKNNLEINTSVGAIVENKLVAYQLVNGKKNPVAVSFRTIDKNTVGFKLGAYDHSKALTVDPLIYGSYYGGDSGMDEVHAVVADTLGGVYMTGSTRSLDFPAVFGPYTFTLNNGANFNEELSGNLAAVDGRDAFVSKLEGDAYRHDYAAYIGGSKDDSGEFLQLDQFGNLWVAGYTTSNDFPGRTVPGSFGVPNVQYLSYDPNASLGHTPGGSPYLPLNGTPTSFSGPDGNGRFRLTLPEVNALRKRLNLQQPIYSDYIPWNASAATVEATLQAFFAKPEVTAVLNGVTVQVTDPGGTGNICDDWSTGGSGYQISLTGVLGEFQVDSTYLGAIYAATRENPQYPSFPTYPARAQLIVVDPGAKVPSQGTYELSLPAGTTQPIAFNASAGDVRVALEGVVGAGNVQVEPAVQTFVGLLPAVPYIVLFSSPQPRMAAVNVDMNAGYDTVPLSVDDCFWNQNSTPPLGPDQGFLPPEPDPDPNGGMFNVRYSGTFTNPGARWNSNAGQLHDVIASHPAIGDTIVVIPEGGSKLPDANMAVVYSGLTKWVFGTPTVPPIPAPPMQVVNNQVIQGSALGTAPVKMLAEDRISPTPVYSVHSEKRCFVMRFKQDSTSVLNPLPTQAFFFGGQVAPILSGFRIIPHANPTTGEPIRLAFCGTDFAIESAIAGSSNALDRVPEVPGVPASGAVDAGFILRVNFTDAGGFSIAPGSTYVSSNFDVEVNGLDVDSNANVYIGGTIKGPFGTTINTGPGQSGNSVFPTTAVDPAGSLPSGNLLRSWDGFARKYSATGALTYSVFVGGTGPDEGLGIAVDPNGQAYLLGRASSFDFPRTRGVFGETFTQDTVSTIAKLNPAATNLVYGTNLRTSGTVRPVGIAVDPRGTAFVTLLISRDTVFPEWSTVNDPNFPSSFRYPGVIPTTPDNLVPKYSEVGGLDYGGTDGALLILNPAGTALLYGTYLGSFLDDVVYPPFVDSSGDVWVCGYTDTFRAYLRGAKWKRSINRFPPSPTTFQLPPSMITSLAFRPTPDPDLGFGSQATQLVPWQLYNTGLDWDPIFWNTFRDRDGWIGRFRAGLATLTSETFHDVTPRQFPTVTSIPGGLGAAAGVRINIDQPAPPGGIPITVTMSPTAPLSFSPDGLVSTTVVRIPGPGELGIGSPGQKSTFYQDPGALYPTDHLFVYSSPVTVNTPVDITATYLGDFKTSRLVVLPWLQLLDVSPAQVVGGNPIAIFLQAAGVVGSGGLNVNLTSSNTAVIPLAGITGVIPGGQTSVSLNALTNGVDQPTTVTLNASLLGAGKSFPVLVQPAQLLSMSFAPNPVTSGSTVTGSLQLNGKAGPQGFLVDLSIQGAPAGYTITPSKLAFNQGASLKTFTVTTPIEAFTTPRVVVATMEPALGYSPNTVTGTINVESAGVSGLSINPTTIDGGGTATGTVTLTNPALAGGAKVNLTVSPSNGVVKVPSQVVVPGGQSTVNFDIQTTTVVNSQTFTVTATRGSSSSSASLTVKALTFSLSAPSVISPSSSGVGTVQLSGAAPAGGIAITLSSSVPTVLSVPNTVVITAGNSSVNFPITTFGITSDTSVTISAKIGTTTHTATVLVQASKLSGMTLNPSYVLNLTTSKCTLTMSGPAPAGGMVIHLTNSNPLIASVPPTVTIPGGATNYSFSIITLRVTRTLQTTIQATGPNGGAAAATLTVHN